MYPDIIHKVENVTNIEVGSRIGVSGEILMFGLGLSNFKNGYVRVEYSLLQNHLACFSDYLIVTGAQVVYTLFTPLELLIGIVA